MKFLLFLFLSGCLSDISVRDSHEAYTVIQDKINAALTNSDYKTACELRGKLSKIRDEICSVDSSVSLCSKPYELTPYYCLDRYF